MHNTRWREPVYVGGTVSWDEPCSSGDWRGAFAPSTSSLRVIASASFIRLSQASNRSSSHTDVRQSNSHRAISGGTLWITQPNHALMRVNSPRASLLAKDVAPVAHPLRKANEHHPHNSTRLYLAQLWICPWRPVAACSPHSLLHLSYGLGAKPIADNNRP